MKQDKHLFTKSQVAAIAAAAGVAPATFVYLKYGRMPSKKLWKVIRKRLRTR